MITDLYTRSSAHITHTHTRTHTHAHTPHAHTHTHTHTPHTHTSGQLPRGQPSCTHRLLHPRCELRPAVHEGTGFTNPRTPGEPQPLLC